MMYIDITPEALSDIQIRKAYLTESFGEGKAKQIIKSVMDNYREACPFSEYRDRYFETLGS